MKVISVEKKLVGKDELAIKLEVKDGKIISSEVRAIGCLNFLRSVQKLKSQLKGELEQLPIPTATDHTSLLIKEVLLLAQSRWHLPYQDDEICHCRGVRTETVCDAIVNGSHTSEAVSLRTNAGTSCGTCKPDVESLLNYYLNHK